MLFHYHYQNEDLQMQVIHIPLLKFHFIIKFSISHLYDCKTIMFLIVYNNQSH